MDSGYRGGMQAVTREQAQVTHVRGPGMSLLRATMLATLSEARQAELRAGLSPEAQDFMAVPMAESTWVPMAVVLEIESAFLALSTVDPFPSHGALMAQRMLEGRLEGLLLGWMGPRAFLRILPLVWGKFNKGGVLRLDHLGEAEATMTLWADYPTPIFVARVAPAYVGEILRRLGAEEATVTYVPPRPGEPAWMHRFQARWKG